MRQKTLESRWCDLVLRVVLTEEPHRRERRDFDIEAERRQRRLFIMLMSGFAVLAIMAGIIVAIWIIPPIEAPNIPPPPQPPVNEPDDIGEIPVWKPEKDPRPSTGPRLKDGLDSKDINRGLRAIQGALDACAQRHGAIDGTRVKVDFSVGGNGRVLESVSENPHAKTPLGLCVAGVIRNRGKFKRTRNGLADIRRTIILHRKDM